MMCSDSTMTNILTIDVVIFLLRLFLVVDIFCVMWHFKGENGFFFYFSALTTHDNLRNTPYSKEHISRAERSVYLNRKEKANGEYFSHFVSRRKS